MTNQDQYANSKQQEDTAKMILQLQERQHFRDWMHQADTMIHEMLDWLNTHCAFCGLSWQIPLQSSLLNSFYPSSNKAFAQYRQNFQTFVSLTQIIIFFRDAIEASGAGESAQNKADGLQ